MPKAVRAQERRCQYAERSADAAVVVMNRRSAEAHEAIEAGDLERTRRAIVSLGTAIAETDRRTEMLRAETARFVEIFGRHASELG